MTVGVFTSSPTTPSQTPRFPKGEGYGALVGERWVRLAPTSDQPVRYYTKDSLASRQDDEGSVYENVLDIGYAFARGDVSGGEGLDWFPRFISQLGDDEVRDKIRYWDSDNIDIRRPVKGSLSRITLSRQQSVWNSFVGLVDLATSDINLFVAYASTVEWWTEWSGGSAGSAVTSLPIVSIEASPAGDVMALLNDGTIEYMAVGSGTFVALTTPLADVVQHWFVKGRFVAEQTNGAQNDLVEFDSTGALGSAFDTFVGGCLSMVSSGPAVVAAISDGTVRSYVPEQSNQLDATSVSLVIRGRTEMPEGEIPYLLGSNADILLILTRTSGNEPENDVRVYQAAVLDSRFDYVVGSIQLRRQWDDIAVTIDTRKNMANTRDEIWFTVREETTTQSVWRFDLVTFGLSRHVTTTVTGDAFGLVVFDERAAYSLATNVYYTNDLFVDEGYIISPNITFGLNTDIDWLSLVVAALGLVSGGAQVELYYSTDPEAILSPDTSSGTPWRLGMRLSSPAAQDETFQLTGVTGKQVALMLKLYSSNSNTVAPDVTNHAVRGLPNHRDWILELPINVSDYIEVPGRRPLQIQGYGNVTHSEMLSLSGKSIEVTVLDPPISFRGIVDNVLEPTAYISDRGSVSVRCVLQCRGDRQTATANPTGDAGMGLGLMGVATMGIGQTGST